MLVSGVQQSDSVICIYIYVYIHTHTQTYSRSLEFLLYIKPRGNLIKFHPLTNLVFAFYLFNCENMMLKKLKKKDQRSATVPLTENSGREQLG